MACRGSGSAGGGTLANELCQKGIKVVVLEAGALQSSATFINDEWKSFAQIAWLDKRSASGSWRVAKDFANLPAWTCKTVGGTTTHWAAAALRFAQPASDSSASRSIPALPAPAATARPPLPVSRGPAAAE